MKQIKKAVALCWMLLLFVGCTSEEPPNLQRLFSCGLTVTYQEVTYQGTFTHSRPGLYTWELTRPVDGITLTLDDGTLGTSLHGLTAEVGVEGLPDSCFLQLCRMFSALSQEATLTYADSRVQVFSGTTVNGNFTVTYNKQTKNPVSLHIGNGITGEIKDFTVL